MVAWLRAVVSAFAPEAVSRVDAASEAPAVTRNFLRSMDIRLKGIGM
jgi:hypothetical protein